jgi:hypothetical protein
VVEVLVVVTAVWVVIQPIRAVVVLGRYLSRLFIYPATHLSRLGLVRHFTHPTVPHQELELFLMA